ncbi:hypothetical protein B6U98_00195 [Thermoplasmatales archaeon ex4572_165]|nr:MAG: hypothetical protein B6U98_00195 [Thermoplasmatales archaeon ex4572_165]
MGLLEQAQLQKNQYDEEDQSTNINIDSFDEIQGSGLLAKANLSKIKKPIPSPKKVENRSELLKKFYEPHDLIEEQTGFGWDGLGKRRIIKLKETSEYLYQVIEPELKDYEFEIKKEIAHLFKMLADINVSGDDEDEQKKYLQEILDQIVKDNDIKFYPVEKKEKTDKKSFSEIFQFKKKNKGKSKKKSSTSPIESIKKIFDKKQHAEEKERLNRIAKESKKRIYYHLFREFVGYHRIDVIMKDEGIEDISCDGPDVPIFLYHKKYDEITTNVQFESPEELNSFVVRLSQICGKQISIFSPIVDGKLPDGSRLQATLARTVTKGSTYTIRRFSSNPLTPIDLIKYQSLSLDMAAYFWLGIRR